MARKSNKQKFIESIFKEIEHSSDPTVQEIYTCLLKEKLDAITKDLKSLMYDEVYSILDSLYDIMIKLDIKDKNHTFVMENITAVLGQKYWSEYKSVLLKENVL